MMAEIFVTVEQMFPMISGPTNNPFGKSISQLFLINQKVHNTPYVAALSSHLHLVQAATYRRSIYNVTISQVFGITEITDTKPWQHLHQTIGFTQLVTKGALERLYQTLHLSQTLIKYLAKNTSSILVFNQSASFHIVKVLTINQSMIYKQGAREYKIGTPTRYTFSATHGPNDTYE
jgi:hypothetical protein